MKCKLKMILWDKKISQKEFSKKIGISESAMSSIVRGSSTPTLETAMKIAKELDMRVEEIWE